MKFYTFKDLEINIKHSPVCFSKKQEQQINSYWNKLKSNDNNLFNGTQFSCSSIKSKEHNQKMEFVPTYYKNYLWVRNNNLSIKGIFPSCVDCVFYSKIKKTFYFVRRSNKVATAKNLISNVGGSIDYNPNIKSKIDFIKYLRKHILIELREEIKTKDALDKSKLHFLGLTTNKSNNFVVFSYIYYDEIIDVNNFENEEVIKVKSGSLINYINNNKKDFFESNPKYYQYLKDYVNKQKHFVYILRCADKSLYTGYTTDLERRLKEHNSPISKTKYTRVRKPVKLVYYKEYNNKNSALRQENSIKRLNRQEKTILINKNIE